MENPQTNRIPIATACAIGSLVWVVAIVGHELLGHGLACVLTGCEPLRFDSMYFEGTPANSVLMAKLRIAAGSAYNVVLAVTCVWLLARSKDRRTWWAYALWVSAMINFMQSGCYILFSRILHPGMDWATFLVGLEPAWVWHLAITLIGALLLLAGIWQGRRYLGLFVESGASERRARLRVVVPPWVAAGVTSTLGALLVTTDDRFWLLMGAIGNSFEFLLPMVLLALWPIRAADGTGEMKQLPVLVGVAVLSLAIFVFLIAPGVEL